MSDYYSGKINRNSADADDETPFHRNLGNKLKLKAKLLKTSEYFSTYDRTRRKIVKTNTRRENVLKECFLFVRRNQAELMESVDSRNILTGVRSFQFPFILPFLFVCFVSIECVIICLQYSWNLEKSGHLY